MGPVPPGESLLRLRRFLGVSDESSTELSGNTTPLLPWVPSGSASSPAPVSGWSSAAAAAAAVRPAEANR